MKTVYLVLDRDDMVMAVFASKENAEAFIRAVGSGDDEPAAHWLVCEREVHYGQPSNPGYNK